MTAPDDSAAMSSVAQGVDEIGARLYETATRDALTGLPNRYYFREAAERALLMAGRQQSPVTVLAVDIDDYGTMVETLGHAAGDAAVQRLGAILEYRFRRSDLIARLAGGAFAVLLPGAARQNALALAENLRAAVEADDGGNGSGNGATLHFTVSVGVAVAMPDNQATLDPLLDLADDALLAARARGRNRVAEV